MSYAVESGRGPPSSGTAMYRMSVAGLIWLGAEAPPEVGADAGDAAAVPTDVTNAMAAAAAQALMRWRGGLTWAPVGIVAESSETSHCELGVE